MAAVDVGDFKSGISDAPEEVRVIFDNLQGYYAQQNKEVRFHRFTRREPKKGRRRYGVSGEVHHDGNITSAGNLLLTISYDAQSRLSKITERFILPGRFRESLVEKLQPQTRAVVTKYDYYKPSGGDMFEALMKCGHNLQITEEIHYLWIRKSEKTNLKGPLSLLPTLIPEAIKGFCNLSPYESQTSEQFLIVNVRPWNIANIDKIPSRRFAFTANGKELVLCQHPPHIYIPVEWPRYDALEPIHRGAAKVCAFQN